MIRRVGTLLLALCLLALAAPSFADDKKDGREVDIPRSKLPEKIAKAVLEAVPGGKIADIDKETKDGKTTWEVGIESGGREFEVDVDDDGKVLRKMEVQSEKMKVAELPVAVIEGVKKEFPGAKITTAEKLTKAGEVTYEMNIDIGKKTWEIVFSPEGKLVSKAEVKEEEEKK